MIASTTWIYILPLQYAIVRVVKADFKFQQGRMNQELNEAGRRQAARVLTLRDHAMDSNSILTLLFSFMWI
jgi:hypothetical protein